jgi:hypothetical protein
MGDIALPNSLNLFHVMFLCIVLPISQTCTARVHIWYWQVESGVYLCFLHLGGSLVMPTRWRTGDGGGGWMMRLSHGKAGLGKQGLLCASVSGDGDGDGDANV